MNKLFRYIVGAVLLFSPTLVQAAELPNPLGGTDTLTELIVVIARALVGLIAVGATFMLIYGGVLMLTSGGNRERVQQGKDILKWTALGIVLIFSAGAILRYIYRVLSPEDFQDISGSIGLGTAGLSETAIRVLNAAIGLLGIVAVTVIIWSGYQWLTAGGNEQRVEKAKQILTGAVVGLVIILLSWAIVNFVLQTGTNVSS